MKLHDIVEAYIDYKHSLGMRFRSQAAVLRAFNRAMGDIAIAAVKPESVLAFIAGTGPITARWMENHRVLGGFYRYAVGRGFATISPLPTDTPRPPTRLTPYIYTIDELKRLLAATEILKTPLSPLLALTMRTLFLLLYGTGMRIGEALSLTLQDVDLENRVLMVRDSKFFKTRLVPIGPRLTTVLSDYLSERCQLPLLAGEASAFLATRTGIRLNYKRVSKLFCRLRKFAEIRREATARYQPRIHDIRHYLPFRTMSGTGTPALFFRQRREVAHDIVLTPSISPKLGKGVHREVYYRLPSSSFASAGRPSRVTYRSVCEVTE